MLPVKHFNDVTKDRAVLLYSIVTRKSIGIGQLIFNNIILTACSPRDGLLYPSLITTLSHQAGVVYSPNKELLHPKIPLDVGIIHKLCM
ncbi:Uncharacterized protein TCM_043746 [Theobroma cacao]|uniref:Putative plant transposon protein domain-containing protein n=1 Tax=Theobroma cacao TaxID=3641 RepID=A0A061FPS8_THECC|nr:Uncharacterized protein TCM_043746 [Theobroma cacao]